MVNFSLSSLYRRTTLVIWDAVMTVFIGAGPVSVVVTNGFPLLRGLKYDDRSTIPRKPILWS